MKSYFKNNPIHIQNPILWKSRIQNVKRIIMFSLKRTSGGFLSHRGTPRKIIILILDGDFPVHKNSNPFAQRPRPAASAGRPSRRGRCQSWSFNMTDTVVFQRWKNGGGTHDLFIDHV